MSTRVGTLFEADRAASEVDGPALVEVAEAVPGAVVVIVTNGAGSFLRIWLTRTWVSGSRKCIATEATVACPCVGIRDAGTSVDRTTYRADPRR